MSRLAALIIAAASLVAVPAEAMVAKTENGVRVWRGAAPVAPIAPSLKGEGARPCAPPVSLNLSVSVLPRRLNVHSFRRNAAFNWETRPPYT
ncbi:MAG: hypothetical protein HXY21_07850, partial [Parvularculaceae bacterium]|nr:hypothetical protein [Parvularculaceae bacterium]